MADESRDPRNLLDIQDRVLAHVARARALVRTLMALDECTAPEAETYATQHSILWDELDAIAQAAGDIIPMPRGAGPGQTENLAIQG